jgi:uncharacterized membrane protein YkoI
MAFNHVPMHLISILLALMLAAAPVSAGDGHDRALAARRSGDIAPLSEILDAVAVRIPGSAIEVELKDRDGRYVYEIEVLTAEGLVVEAYVDAHTKEILNTHLEHAEHD